MIQKLQSPTKKIICNQRNKKSLEKYYMRLLTVWKLGSLYSEKLIVQFMKEQNMRVYNMRKFGWNQIKLKLHKMMTQTNNLRQFKKSTIILIILYFKIQIINLNKALLSQRAIMPFFRIQPIRLKNFSSLQKIMILFFK